GDLAFYLVSGCSTSSGPSSAQCLVFEDASTGEDEVAHFVAQGPSVYVVVDYYASHAPPEGTSFTLDVYAETCQTNAQCGGATPVCSNGTCVECASSFDCKTAAKPRCDTTVYACKAGVDQCLVEDPAEPSDDGPAGATLLVPDASGDAMHTAMICSSPSGERDFFAFDVTTLGDVWDVTLAWTGNRDLDL